MLINVYFLLGLFSIPNDHNQVMPGKDKMLNANHENSTVVLPQLTDKSAQEKIVELESQVKELEARVEELEEELASKQQESDSLEADVDNLKKEVCI